MTAIAYEQGWLQLSDKIAATGHLIVKEAQGKVTDINTEKPEVLAITLLIRTLSHFKATLALTCGDMLVEARIMVRHCFENLFWVGSLLSRRENFIKEIHDHELRKLQNSKELVFEITHLNENTEEELRRRLLDFNVKTQNALFLNPKKAAYKGGLKDDYKIYSQLSADFSHPSLAALRRYITESEAETGEIRKQIEQHPRIAESEITDTLYLACYSTLGVCALVCDIVGLTKGEEMLEEITGEYKKLKSQTAN